MTSLKTIVAAALLSALAGSHVFAQAAISEPGEFSFYHPDRDVLNGGAPIWGGRVVPAPYSDSQAYYPPTKTASWSIMRGTIAPCAPLIDASARHAGRP